jgi:hypothetical protein
MSLVKKFQIIDFFKNNLEIKVTIHNFLVGIVLKDNLLVLRLHIMTMSYKRVG